MGGVEWGMRPEGAGATRKPQQRQHSDVFFAYSSWHQLDLMRFSVCSAQGVLPLQMPAMLFFHPALMLVCARISSSSFAWTRVRRGVASA